MPAKQYPLRLTALAVMAALTSPATMASAVTLTADTTQDYAGTSGEKIQVQLANGTDSIKNSHAISGFGTLKIQSWKTLVNTGTIDVGHYGDADVAASKLNNQGSLIINDEEFDIALINSSRITAKKGTLKLLKRTAEFQSGSTIVDSDGNRLKEIVIDYQSNGVGNTTVAEGAVLTADKISIDVYNQGLALNGSITGDDIVIKGSYINLGHDALISGTNVTLGAYINQVKSGPTGGTIKASQNLVLSGSPEFKDIEIDAPTISASGQLVLHGTSTIKNLQRLELGSTFRLLDEASIADNYLPEVAVLAHEKVINAPRIEIAGSKPLSIGTVTVGKSTDASGAVISAKFVDKMTTGENGSASLSIENLIVDEGAKLAIYADNKTGSSPATKVQIGTLAAGKDTVVELGWRSDGSPSMAEWCSEKIRNQTNAFLHP